MSELQDHLTWLIEGRFYRVEYVDDVPTGGLADGANGRVDYGQSLVRIRSGLDEEQTTKTLCHELAHILMHEPGMPHENRERRELEAALVTWLVMRTAGRYTATDVRRMFTKAVMCAAQILLSYNPKKGTK